MVNRHVKTSAAVVIAGALFAAGGMATATAKSLITGDDIANNTVTAQNLAPNSVGKSELQAGLEGKDGKDGKDGKTGPAGPAGESGTAGAEGTRGLQGLVGPAGSRREQGRQGRPWPVQRPCRRAVHHHHCGQLGRRRLHRLPRRQGRPRWRLPRERVRRRGVPGWRLCCERDGHRIRACRRAQRSDREHLPARRRSRRTRRAGSCRTRGRSPCRTTAASPQDVRVAVVCADVS